MRRIFRLPLPEDTQKGLEQLQTGLDKLLDNLEAVEPSAQKKQIASNVDAYWQKQQKGAKRKKKPTALREVQQTLRKMFGRGYRCVYCSHSTGSDIEHFWPKAGYPQRTFEWSNLLLCCTECGRYKGKQFPLDDNAQPLLIDASTENPWDYLDFDPDTHLLRARATHTGSFSPKGRKHVEVLRLGRDAISEEYGPVYDLLSDTVELFLKEPSSAQSLFKQLRKIDTKGLLGWIFLGLGSQVPPFQQLQSQHPEIWHHCESATIPLFRQV